MNNTLSQEMKDAYRAILKELICETLWTGDAQFDSNDPVIIERWNKKRKKLTDFYSLIQKNEPLVI